MFCCGGELEAQRAGTRAAANKTKRLTFTRATCDGGCEAGEGGAGGRKAGGGGGLCSTLQRRGVGCRSRGGGGGSTGAGGHLLQQGNPHGSLCTTLRTRPAGTHIGCNRSTCFKQWAIIHTNSVTFCLNQRMLLS